MVFSFYWNEIDGAISLQQFVSLVLVEISLFVVGFGVGTRGNVTIQTVIDREYGDITRHEFRGSQLVESRRFGTDEVIKFGVTTEQERTSYAYRQNTNRRSNYDPTPTLAERVDTYSNIYGVTVALNSGEQLHLTARHHTYGWEDSLEAVNTARYYLQPPIGRRKKRKLHDGDDFDSSSRKSMLPERTRDRRSSR